ncbi:MAG: ribbon-helix-helix protein, CopG family [Candidatus Bipolaricaulia bacterium]
MASQTVKVAVSLPKEEFQAVEQLRKQLEISRSALITEAIRYWLNAKQKEEEIRHYIEGYQRYPETAEEISEVATIAQKTLMAEEWEE